MAGQNRHGYEQWMLIFASSVLTCHLHIGVHRIKQLGANSWKRLDKLQMMMLIVSFLSHPQHLQLWGASQFGASKFLGRFFFVTFL